MSNRYDEELPADVTERELYKNMLANQTITKASAYIGGSIAVVFGFGNIAANGVNFWGLLYAALLFAGGFVLFALFKVLVAVLRHLEVHPVVIYLTAAFGPILVGLMVSMVRG